MTPAELAELIRTLPGVRTRWGIVKDLPACLAVGETCGDWWEERHFREVLKRRNCIIMVATCQATEQVRGFAVYELDTEDQGWKFLTVLNLCAIDPVARYALIGKLGEKALKNSRTLTWATPTY